jgi:hypothetical protein
LELVPLFTATVREAPPLAKEKPTSTTFFLSFAPGVVIDPVSEETTVSLADFEMRTLHHIIE